MATERFHLCPTCGWRTRAESLFDSLLGIARAKPRPCAHCATSTVLHLSSPFGLGAGTFQWVVVDAFVPDKPVKWSYRRRRVTFYPFLVVIEREGERRHIWLPYRHVVRGKGKQQKKYGQWAPWMELSTFKELVAKARRKGYLT